MRPLWLQISTSLAVVAVAACGSSSGTGTPDSGKISDAKVSTADARTASDAPALGDARPGADAPPGSADARPGTVDGPVGAPDARLGTADAPPTTTADAPPTTTTDAPVTTTPDAPITTTPDAPITTPPDAPPPPPDAPPVLPTLTLKQVATELANPLVIVIPPGETRYFVAEQSGAIQIIGADGMPLMNPFLDISGEVSVARERGFLGMAFHPDYADNGRFFVYFTGNDTNGATGDIHVWEFHHTSGDVADDGHKEVLEVDHHNADNHNGGNILFGPDGKLYIGIGDGGDQFGSMKTTRVLTTRLSKLLRIDVTTPPYTAPPDNPFIGDPSDAAHDIWMWGLRNPFRWSFDRETHDLWIGDVGQNNWEELDVWRATDAPGLDFGWNVEEGMDHDPHDSNVFIHQAGSTLPVYEYFHQDNDNAVIGGYVYRGSITALRGQYFFGDDGSGKVRSFPATSTSLAHETATRWPMLDKGGISTFGEDPDGELLMCAIGATGTCWRIVVEQK